ncbi:MAG: HD domain-containing protein [Gemmiger sp.]
MSNFETTLQDLESDARIQPLKTFRQHRTTTTYDHCVHVAKSSYRLARFLGIRIDGAALARGAMLHDYYLYDTRCKNCSAYSHGIHHAARALRNAGEQYELSPIEQNIIYSHMWPLNLTHLPRCREAVLVCMADKYCALLEAMWGKTRRMPCAR